MRKWEICRKNNKKGPLIKCHQSINFHTQPYFFFLFPLLLFIPSSRKRVLCKHAMQCLLPYFVSIRTHCCWPATYHPFKNSKTNTLFPRPPIIHSKIQIQKPTYYFPAGRDRSSRWRTNTAPIIERLYQLIALNIIFIIYKFHNFGCIFRKVAALHIFQC